MILDVTEVLKDNLYIIEHPKADVTVILQGQDGRDIQEKHWDDLEAGQTVADVRDGAYP